MQIDSSQTSAVNASPNHPLIILAGPGSGKTSTLIERTVSILGKCEGGCLVLTFSVAASNEFRTRLHDKTTPQMANRVNVATFHGFAYRLIKLNWFHIGFLSPPTICSHKEGKEALREAIRENASIKEEYSSCLDSTHQGNSSCYKLLKMIQDIKNSDPDNYFTQRVSPQSGLPILFAEFQKKLMEKGLLQFSDMVPLAVRLLQNHSSVGEQLEKVTPFVLADEFQDTNKPQLQLLLQLCKNHGRVTVVGDKDQLIYGFQGAEASNFRELFEYFEKKESMPQVLSLNANYRSNASICHACNVLINSIGQLSSSTARGAPDNSQFAKMVLRKKEMVSHYRGEWISGGVEEGEIPKLQIVGCRSMESQCEWIINKINLLLNDPDGPELQPGEIAILYRTNKLGEWLKPYLQRGLLDSEGNRVPLSFKQSKDGEGDGGAEGTGNHVLPLSSKVLACLRLISNLNDDVAFSEALPVSLATNKQAKTALAAGANALVQAKPSSSRTTSKVGVGAKGSQRHSTRNIGGLFDAVHRVIRKGIPAPKGGPHIVDPLVYSGNSESSDSSSEDEDGESDDDEHWSNLKSKVSADDSDDDDFEESRDSKEKRHRILSPNDNLEHSCEKRLRLNSHCSATTRISSLAAQPSSHAKVKSGGHTSSDAFVSIKNVTAKALENWMKCIVDIHGSLHDSSRSGQSLTDIVSKIMKISESEKHEDHEHDDEAKEIEDEDKIDMAFLLDACEKQDDNGVVTLSTLEQFLLKCRGGLEVARKKRNFAGKGSALACSGIYVGTIHRAKGREWKAVILVHATDDVFGHAQQDSSDKVNIDAVNLLYVAMSRAKEMLCVTFLDTQTSGISRYLRPLINRQNGVPCDLVVFPPDQIKSRTNTQAMYSESSSSKSPALGNVAYQFHSKDPDAIHKPSSAPQGHYTSGLKTIAASSSTSPHIYRKCHAGTSNMTTAVVRSQGPGSHPYKFSATQAAIHIPQQGQEQSLSSSSSSSHPYSRVTSSSVGQNAGSMFVKAASLMPNSRDHFEGNSDHTMRKYPQLIKSTHTNPYIQPSSTQHGADIHSVPMMAARASSCISKPDIGFASVLTLSGYNNIPGNGIGITPGSGYIKTPGSGYSKTPGNDYISTPGSGYGNIQGSYRGASGSGYNSPPGSSNGRRCTQIGTQAVIESSNQTLGSAGPRAGGPMKNLNSKFNNSDSGIKQQQSLVNGQKWPNSHSSSQTQYICSSESSYQI